MSKDWLFRKKMARTEGQKDIYEVCFAISGIQSIGQRQAHPRRVCPGYGFHCSELVFVIKPTT